MAHKNHFSVLAEIHGDEDSNEDSDDSSEDGTGSAAAAANTSAEGGTGQESVSAAQLQPPAAIPALLALPPLKNIMTFTVTRGTHIIVLPSPEAHGVGGRVRSGKTTSSAPTFYGRCYNCNFTLHSQKHCPLRQCTKCLAWGHIEAVCAPLPPATAPPWKLPAADRASSDKTCATE